VNETLTAVVGLEVGHWTDTEAATGCTVVLCPPEGCVASASVRGGAPGTREVALLEPEKHVGRVHAVLLAGGSAFGLAAAEGVMRFLEARGIGFKTPFASVPIVPAAVIFDLASGRSDLRPDASAGYLACEAASAAPVALGRVGAGAGATVGKYLGFAYAEWGGVGSASRRVEGATLAALAVVNPIGDVIDPHTGAVVAGARSADGSRPLEREVIDLFAAPSGMHTTLVVVASDAPLSKAGCKALAESAHAGIARVIRPSHTPLDGDTAFVLSTAKGPEVGLVPLAVATQAVVAEAILSAVRVANAR
jgi:L-aminopeptidase/D-esterase-like protein